MYLALRFVSFLLKITAVLYGLMVLFVYVMVQVAASGLYNTTLSRIRSPAIDPTFFVTVCSTFVTFSWLVGCVGIYALAQFIDAFLSIEKNVRTLAGHKLYEGFDEKPRRSIWEDR